ncbi:MAG: GvpL/GvpF family gas vesicle protein [Streptosporangiaceae bacterium]
MASDDGIWIYAITSQAGQPGVGHLPGVAGTGVGTLSRSGLTALISPVDLAEFGEDALREALEKLPWLESVARSHHAVIEAAAAGGRPVIPMRLATVYRGRAGLAALLTDRRDELAAALRRLAGRAEWGVKLYCVPAEPGRPAGATSDPGGAAYLRRRKAELSRVRDMRRAAAAAAERLHAELSAVADAACLHRPQDPGLSGRPETMLMNAAYLVRKNDADRLAALARAADRRDVPARIELTGPWPPYSFAALPDQAAGSASGAPG